MSERKPTLSEGSMKFKVDSLAYAMGGDLPYEESQGKTAIRYGMLEAIGFYENLIDTGELAVVKTVKDISEQAFYFRCSGCLETREMPKEDWVYCPGCGAEITE